MLKTRNTGAFGPYLLTSDELQAGGKGLPLWTRLNGAVVQDASTIDMVIGIARMISILSGEITLRPGDILASDTPEGVGMARTPQRFMKHGELCEVEFEGIGAPRHRVEEELRDAALGETTAA